MAEPMTSNEIEDVLSSIRRLVAKDAKADHFVHSTPGEGAQKLVLAPEQRVEEADATAPKFTTVRRPSRRAAFPPVDAVLDDFSAIPSAVIDATPAPQSQPQPQPQPQDWALGGDAPTGARPADIPPASVEDWPPTNFAFADDTEAEETVAEAPDFSAQEAPANGADFAVNPNARLFDAAQGGFSGGFVPPQPMAEPAPKWRDPEPEDAPSTAFSAEQPADGQGLNGTIEPDRDWADAAEASVIAELAEQAVTEEVYAQASASLHDPYFTAHPGPQSPVIDQDDLRALVKAIFREEMSGPMGERMTRSIRKLVRAEVGRLLAAQELE